MFYAIYSSHVTITGAGSIVKGMSRYGGTSGWRFFVKKILPDLDNSPRTMLLSRRANHGLVLLPLRRAIWGSGGQCPPALPAQGPPEAQNPDHQTARPGRGTGTGSREGAGAGAPTPRSRAGNRTGPPQPREATARRGRRRVGTAKTATASHSADPSSTAATSGIITAGIMWVFCR